MRVPIAVVVLRLFIAMLAGAEVWLLFQIRYRVTWLSILIGGGILASLILAFYKSFIRRRGSVYYIVALMILLCSLYSVAFNCTRSNPEWEKWLLCFPLEMILPVCYAWYLLSSKKVREFFKEESTCREDAEKQVAH